MASLTNTKIKDTYDGLLKTTDNDALGGTYKLITDGLGNSSGLYLGTGGRLGLGTSSPSEKLDVIGTIRSSANEGKLVLNSTATNGKEYQFISIDSGNLGLFDGTAYRLWVAGSGDIGIGTTSPDRNLTIKNSSDGVNGLSFQSYAANTEVGYIRYEQTNDILDIVNTSSFGGSGIKFSTNNTERLRIDSSGNVLINRTGTSGLGKLNVEGGADFTGGNVLLCRDTGNVGIGTSSPSGGKLQIDTGVTSLNQGIPATSGTSQNGILRLTPGGGTYGETLDIGMNVGTTYAWIQPTNKDNLSVNYNLALNPNGGNVGIGTSSPQQLLSIQDTSNNAYLHCVAGTSNLGGVWVGDSDSDYVGGFLYDNGQNASYFYTNGSERMRIDSSGRLGLGTSSPSHNLTINSATGGQLQFQYNTSSRLRIEADSGGGSYYAAAGFYHRFFTSGVERMRIDSVGEVSVYNDFTIDNGSPEMYFKTGGSHYRWMIAAQENVDAALEITPSTTLGGGTYSSPVALFKATGQVGIGVSSPSAKLEVKGSGDGDLFIGRHSSTNAKLIYGYQSASDGFLELRTAGDVTVSKLSGYTGTPSYFKSNVGIGTSSPSSLLQVLGSPVATSGALITARNDDATSSNTTFGGIMFNSSPGTDYSIGKSNVNTATTLSFRNANTGASYMDIDSSGRVGIGTSSITNSRVQIKGAGNATNTYVDGLKVTSNNETVYTQYNWNGINNNTALSFATGGTERMLIESDGGLFVYNLLGSTSVSNPQIRYNISTKEFYYQSSSLRYKEEVENLDSQIDKLMNLRTVKFKTKETNQNAIGLIAEEVAEVIPELTFKNEVEGFDEPQIDGVSYGDLPTYLLKAIQEQQEMINELKSEIQTLKSQINS